MASAPAKKSGDQSVRVYLRVRPPIGREIVENHPCGNLTFDPQDPTAVIIRASQDDAAALKRFTFHRVFPPTSTQSELYEHYAKEAVAASFEGYHGVLFVYGQTGSGKTYTICNGSEKPQDQGMLQQSLLDVWSRIEQDKEFEYNCAVSYVEIYNEAISDLLAEKGDDNKVRLQSGQYGEVTMLNETTGAPIEHHVSSYAETLGCFTRGVSLKQMRKTDMNATSSRSHTIFTLSIEKAQRVAGANGSGGTRLTALKGKLILCDLAGSERASKTGAEGAALKEANNINTSLLVLGNVVKALTEKKAQHAPFRESKLTRILQYSLSGNGKTAIVVNVSPSDDNTQESIGAIGFGQRAILIKQRAQRHEVLDYRALYLQLQAELDRRVEGGVGTALEEAQRAAKEQADELNGRIALLEQENAALKQENAAMRSGKSPVTPASGGAAGAAAGGARFSDDSWRSVVDKQKEALDEATRRAERLRGEVASLQKRLHEEERQTFALGIRFRDTLRITQQQRAEGNNALQMLQAEIAALRGTEYLAATLPDMETSGSPAVGTGGGGEASPLTASTGRASGFDELLADNEKLLTAVGALRRERTELLVYQHKAARAIRLLYAESQRR